MTHRFRPRAVALLAVVMVLSQDVPLTPRERAMVQGWLTCLDCTAELDSVRATATRTTAAVDTLAAALLQGPAQSSLLRAASALALGYVRDSLYRAAHQLPPVVVSRDSAVHIRVQRWDDGYRSRAAIALGWIHTPRAVDALNHAFQAPLTDQVRRAVVYARDSLP